MPAALGSEVTYAQKRHKIVLAIQNVDRYSLCGSAGCASSCVKEAVNFFCRLSKSGLRLRSAPRRTELCKSQNVVLWSDRHHLQLTPARFRHTSVHTSCSASPPAHLLPDQAPANHNGFDHYQNLRHDSTGKWPSERYGLSAVFSLSDRLPRVPRAANFTLNKIRSTYPNAGAQVNTRRVDGKRPEPRRT